MWWWLISPFYHPGILFKLFSHGEVLTSSLCTHVQSASWAGDGPSVVWVTPSSQSESDARTSIPSTDEWTLVSLHYWICRIWPQGRHHHAQSQSHRTSCMFASKLSLASPAAGHSPSAIEHYNMASRLHYPNQYPISDNGLHPLPGGWLINIHEVSTCHDYVARCYGKPQKCQQGWRTRAVAMHLVAARLVCPSSFAYYQHRYSCTLGLLIFWTSVIDRLWKQDLANANVKRVM